MSINWLPRWDQWEYLFASICLFAGIWILTLGIAKRIRARES